MKDKIVICDFDGTITKRDSLDLFLDTYAKDDWRKYEKLWFENKIGSRECIRLQFDMLDSLDAKELDRFLRSVEIDDYFAEFYTKAKAQNIKVVIVSDGFDLFIDNILKNNGIEDLDVYTNHLEFVDGKFVMQFPNISKDCKKHSGTCKCKIVNDLKSEYNTTFYVGDGISDFCVCDKTDYLFAKRRLSVYCEQNNISFVPYNTFNEVLNYDKLGLII